MQLLHIPHLDKPLQVTGKVPDATLTDDAEIRDTHDACTVRAAPARCGHHPHELADTSIAVDFIKRAIGLNDESVKPMGSK